MPTLSCQTCSSTLLPSHLASTFSPTCCNSPICSRCLEKNPRLREYVPCLRCGDPRNAMSGGASSHQDRRERGGEVVFDVADLEVDLDLGSDAHNGAEEDEIDALPPPPGYDEVVVGMEHMDFTRRAGAPSMGKVGNNVGNRIGGSGSSLEPSRRESFAHTKNIQDCPHIQEKANINTETVQVIHKIQRGDTLLSVARKYAADPHEIIYLNSLPPSALTSYPRILQTRKSLIVSQRSVPWIPSSQSPPEHMHIGKDGNEEETDERRRQRQEKRFQLLTKSTDPAIGRAYIGVEELEEKNLSSSLDTNANPRHPLEYSTGESLVRPHPQFNPIKHLAGETENEMEKSKKMVVPEEGNREERALGRFWDDELWEAENGTSLDKERRKIGKWNVVGGDIVRDFIPPVLSSKAVKN
ncbi:hypothetical protein C345_03145 [Cryptococcus neoformans A2-102-5]|nr:hypothetical protein C346_03263 [Cryptococcus neoformans var. grubii D17-1]OXG95624.1 hypothetical protein C345_03145 [Cryptococcus neoformans var. grubii A2-102-5]